MQYRGSGRKEVHTGFNFLKRSSKNIEMAPRGARWKLLIFDEALIRARAGRGQLFSTASRLPGETGEVWLGAAQASPVSHFGRRRSGLWPARPEGALEHVVEGKCENKSCMRIA